LRDLGKIVRVWGGDEVPKVLGMILLTPVLLPGFLFSSESEG
jgi:hypothetical protein